MASRKRGIAGEAPEKSVRKNLAEPEEPTEKKQPSKRKAVDTSGKARKVAKRQSHQESSAMRKKHSKTSSASSTIAGKKSLTRAMSVARKQKGQVKSATKPRAETPKRRSTKTRTSSATDKKQQSAPKVEDQSQVVLEPSISRPDGPTGSEAEQSGTRLRRQPHRKSKGPFSTKTSEPVDDYMDKPSTSKAQEPSKSKVEESLGSNVRKGPQRKGKSSGKRSEAVPTGAAARLKESQETSGTKVSKPSGSKPLRQQPDRKSKGQAKSVPADQGSHVEEGKGDANVLDCPELTEDDDSAYKYPRRSMRLMLMDTAPKDDE